MSSFLSVTLTIVSNVSSTVCFNMVNTFIYLCSSCYDISILFTCTCLYFTKETGTYVSYEVFDPKPFALFSKMIQTAA